MNRNAKLTVIGALTAFLCTTTSVLAFSPNKSVHPHPHIAPPVHLRLHVPSISDRVARAKHSNLQNHKTSGLRKRSNPALSSQEAAQAAKELQRIKQMRDAEQAHDVFGGSGSASDPAAGTALGGHGLSLGDNGNDENNAINRAARTRDCLANPANCLSNNSQRSAGPGGMMSGPPTAIPGGIDRRGQASTDLAHSLPGTSDQPGSALFYKKHGNIVDDVSTSCGPGCSVWVGRYEDGTRVTYTRDEPRNRTTEKVEYPDGSRDFTVETEESTTLEHHDATEGEPERGESAGSGEAGQPGLNDSSTGNADPCGWTPWGCRSARDVRTSIKQMTSQPAQSESGGTGTGSGAPRLGSEAVTNPGDGSWSPQTAGRSGGGHPIDMRDPTPRGPDGTPVRPN